MPAMVVDTLTSAMVGVLEEGPLCAKDLDRLARKEANVMAPGHYMYNSHLFFVKNTLLKSGKMQKFRCGNFIFYYLTDQVPAHLRGECIEDFTERAIFCDWLADNKPELEAAWRKTLIPISKRKKTGK